jgi:hypothetical protein
VWLDALAEPNRLASTCGFTEPNLEFRAILDVKRPMLRVCFELEARPSWACDAHAASEDIWVEFPIEELDLRSAAVQWRAELSRYPQRAAR